MTWWLSDPRLRRTFFLAYFRLPPLLKHERKKVGGFGKKSFVSTLCEKARKLRCVTARHDMTLAVKVALNPNTIIQSVINFTIKVVWESNKEPVTGRLIKEYFLMMAFYVKYWYFFRLICHRTWPTYICLYWRIFFTESLRSNNMIGESNTIVSAYTSYRHLQ